MLKYIIPFFAYIAIEPIIDFWVGNDYLGYILRAIVTGVLLVYYFKQYRELKTFKFSFPSILVGIAIFIIWISMEGLYPRLSSGFYDPNSAGAQFFTVSIIFKLVSMILIAPLIEELFTKSFLLRAMIQKDYTKVPIGKFTVSSFIITVLFFGFSHAMWLPGIITGIILNLLLYRTKNIWACVQAHAAANIALAVYVLITHNWIFW